eukprot:9318703-Prorocentrum_lima.AAC.1
MSPRRGGGRNAGWPVTPGEAGEHPVALVLPQVRRTGYLHYFYKLILPGENHFPLDSQKSLHGNQRLQVESAVSRW